MTTQVAVDYYTINYSVVTARRAALFGAKPTRHYGYYVMSDQDLPAHYPGTERLACWCSTKEGAETVVAEKIRSQRSGTYGCDCGSGKQSRWCCGIPERALRSN